MRTVCFTLTGVGHVRVCVYEGYKGRIRKFIGEEGTYWPWDFSLESRPIWCGETYTQVQKQLLNIEPTFSDGKFRAGSGMELEIEDACAAAWADMWACDWYDENFFMLGHFVESMSMGGFAWDCYMEEYKSWLHIPIEQWWAAFPGVQPTRVVWRMDYDTFDIFAGDIWIPEFFQTAKLDGVNYEIEIDVSDFSFPVSDWEFEITTDRMQQPFACKNGGDYILKGSYMDINEPGLIDIYGGEVGWECIDIPDWVINSKGKHWISMVDDAGGRLPGPYIPL